MSVIGNPLLLSPEGYQIERSVRTRQSAGGNFRRVPASAGNAQKFTISMWKKLGSTGGYLAAANLDTLSALFSEIELTTAGNVSLRSGTLGVSYAWILTSVQLFRDPAAWYHIVIAYDTTQATSTERCKVWVNNQLLTFTGSYPAQNYSTAFNTTAPQYLAVGDGYAAEIHYVDGQQLAPSNFGEVSAATGVWQPKKYLGTYGTNGAYLNFSDPSGATATTIGKDYSGNGNNWTPNNISVTAGVTYDSMLDVPTMWADGGNGRGNYAVMNPLDVSPTEGSGRAVFSNGNLTLVGGNQFARGWQIPSSGQWYWEITLIDPYVGLPNIWGGHGVSSGLYGNCTGVPLWADSTGGIMQDGTKVQTFSTWANNDVIGFAYDAATRSMSVYRNGTQLGTSVTASATDKYVYSYLNGTADTSSVAYNFGQRPFAYTPPTGFKALNTQNLPEPTIKKGNQYFDVSLFTGTGSAQVITNSGGMQPDLVWVKGRGEVASNRLVDSVRGVDKVIYSNLTNAETTEDGVVDSFNLNGFTGGGANAVTSGYAGVAWQWKESASAGFDIVTYTGNGGGASGLVVNHNLGVAPSMMMVKARSSTVTENAWNIYHKSMNNGVTPENYFMRFDTGAQINATNRWSNIGSSSVKMLAALVDNATPYIAYLFAEVAGFSKFGSYTGNGSADGPFVFCGFRPAFVLMKRTDAVSSWYINDTGRSPDNDTTGEDLYPNLSDAQGGTVPIDILSNGFKMRTANNSRNQSGGTYIYAAFAEHPFSKALAR